MSLIKLIDLPSLGDQRGGLVAIESNQSIPLRLSVCIIFLIQPISLVAFMHISI